MLQSVSPALSHAISAGPSPRFVGSQTWRSQFLPIRSKQSHFQDFQDYAKPLRLLQVGEAKVCIETLEDKVLSSHNSDVSCALYKVELGTSRFSGSSLSDTNAGVLLCLIDENGDSILQRIPSSLGIIDCSADSESESPLHFQRGSLDEFIFEGAKLGSVKALWISIESGQWRLDKVRLTVIHMSQPSPSTEKKSEPEIKYDSVKYEFQVEDIQLGEGSDTSMLELRPCLITKLSGVGLSTLFSRSISESTLLKAQTISNQESMREYSNLKLSLLLYDATLVLIGTSAASFSAGDRAAFAFLVGGVSGFWYLLLLQRSVDGLPSPQHKGTSDEGFGGYKGPMISSFALAIGFSLFAVKYSSGELRDVLTAKDVVLGMMGFLASKVSVVLAALKPLSKRIED